MSSKDQRMQSLSSSKRGLQSQTIGKFLQAKKAKELSILYDVYDLKAQSKIKCNNKYFTVSELLDFGWTVEQIVKQKYI